MPRFFNTGIGRKVKSIAKGSVVQATLTVAIGLVGCQSAVLQDTAAEVVWSAKDPT